MKKKIQIFFSILIVLITIYIFTKYIVQHHQIISRLLKVNPLEIILIILLYGLIFISLYYLLKFMVEYFDIKIDKKDNLLLNAYSLLANFSFFGQAGPGIRAIYLRNKFKLTIKKFIFITLVYYSFYSIIAICFILFGSNLKLIWSILIILAVIGGNFVIIRWYLKRRQLDSQKHLLSIKSLVYIFLAALVQLAIQTIIYAIELESIGKFAIHQIVAYSGFADLALFASITPGGIGIREAFLVFSEKIHHIPTASIVLASLIDRSAYFIYLIILLIIVLLFHGFKRIKKLNLVNKNELEK